MILPLAVGILGGVGVALAVRSLVPRPVPLPVAFDRLERLGVSVADLASSDAPTRGASVLGRIGRLVIGDLESDLAVLDRTVERHAVEKLTVGVAFFALPLVLALVLGAGGIGVPVAAVVVASLLAGPLGVLIPDLTVRSQAAARREAFRHALSSYLDLVNVLLAGGAGVETALEAAADAGDGWSFSAIRGALLRSRTVRSTPWHCFAELGAAYGITELTELAASVQLAGEHGARIRTSLVAKAAALRSHQMARIEADAQSATERMGLPTVLMFVGFLVLLGYPAVQMIVVGFGP